MSWLVRDSTMVAFAAGVIRWNAARESIYILHSGGAAIGKLNGARD